MRRAALNPGGRCSDPVSQKIVQMAGAAGSSVFDPVLCELVYRWFCPRRGRVLDPFAGGSVRGIVAAKLNLDYLGIELRREQVRANRAQARKIVPDRQPRWLVGDARQVRTLASGRYDLLFSCPPYGNLEVYSDDQRDLSAMRWPDFIAAYREIIVASVGLLRRNRFACFVVANFRGPRGFYRDLVGETVRAFETAGTGFYNDAVLVTSAGTLPLRAGGPFVASRKPGKTHQNVLVFCKGDPKRATALLGAAHPASKLPAP